MFVIRFVIKIVLMFFIFIIKAIIISATIVNIKEIATVFIIFEAFVFVTTQIVSMSIVILL